MVVFVNDPPSAERRIDFAVFLLSYGLMVGKYAPWKFRKFVWLFISSRDCFIYGTNVTVFPSFGISFKSKT